MGVKRIHSRGDVFAAYKEIFMFTHSTDICGSDTQFKAKEDAIGRMIRMQMDVQQKVFRSTFCYLSDLFIGREGVITLLVCFLVPAELLKFAIKLGLKDYVFLERILKVLVIWLSWEYSLDWDFSEKQTSWQLLMSEVQDYKFMWFE